VRGKAVAEQGGQGDTIKVDFEEGKEQLTFSSSKSSGDNKIRKVSDELPTEPTPDPRSNE
jgi:hypothetical protein